MSSSSSSSSSGSSISSSSSSSSSRSSSSSSSSSSSISNCGILVLVANTLSAIQGNPAITRDVNETGVHAYKSTR